MISFYLFLACILFVLFFEFNALFLKILMLLALFYLILLINQRYTKKRLLVALIVILLFVGNTLIFSIYFKVNQTLTLQNQTLLLINRKETEKTVQYVAKTTNLLSQHFLIIQAKEQSDYNIGDYVSVTGKAEPITSVNNRYLFNYERYSKSIKQFHQLYQPHIQPLQQYGYHKTILTLKDTITKQLQNNYDEQLRPYLLAFLLGDTSELSTIQQQYFELGIMHLFVFSTRYLRLIEQLLKRLLSKFRIADATIEVGVFGLIYSYSLMLWKNMALKKLVLLKLLQMGAKMGEKAEMDQHNLRLTLQSISGIILLWLNPYYIYSTGFLYLYVMSTLFIIYQKHFTRLNILQRKFAHNMLGTIFILPITLYQQQQFQLLQVCYLFIFSIVGRILFVLSLVLLCFPILAPLITVVFLTLIDLTTYFLNNSDTIQIPWLFLTNSLILYLLIFLLIDKKMKHLLFSLVLIFNLLIFNYTLESIHFLSLPYGEVTIIKLQNTVYMIDVGGHYQATQNQYQVDTIIIPFLAQLKITTIDHLILTHNDSDHLGAAPYFLTQFSVTNVYINSTTPTTQFADINLHIVESPVRLPDLQIFPLFTASHYGDNNLSLISYGIFGNKAWLFMGDIEAEGERAFIKNYPDINIDILKLGHHGSKTSSTQAFLTHLSPEIAIITVQHQNIHKHPHDEVLKRLIDNKITYYLTNDVGSIHYYFCGFIRFFDIE